MRIDHVWQRVVMYVEGELRVDAPAVEVDVEAAAKLLTVWVEPDPRPTQACSVCGKPGAEDCGWHPRAGQAVAPMNRCSSTYNGRRCVRQTCHNGSCDWEPCPTKPVVGAQVLIPGRVSQRDHSDGAVYVEFAAKGSARFGMWFEDSQLHPCTDYPRNVNPVAVLRGWLCTIIEDAETLDEARAWARRALDKEDCPEDPRTSPTGGGASE